MAQVVVAALRKAADELERKTTKARSHLLSGLNLRAIAEIIFARPYSFTMRSEVTVPSAPRRLSTYTPPGRALMSTGA